MLTFSLGVSYCDVESKHACVCEQLETEVCALKRRARA
jgi:hypothetical protein